MISAIAPGTVRHTILTVHGNSMTNSVQDGDVPRLRSGASAATKAVRTRVAMARPTRTATVRIRRLRRAELPVDTAVLARYLVGKILVHDHPAGRIAGRIVETEAYVVGDAAAHAFRGETPRNRSLFLEHGHAYVYFVYGCWYALNVSGETAGIGAGVLLRALEPIEGIELMQRRRGTKRLLDLARGPGRLAMAMGVDRSLDGVDLCGTGPLWLGADRRRPALLGESVRIGITREVHRKLRFFERDNVFVSGARRFRG